MKNVEGETNRPARILVIDDVQDSREILARRFERRGYQVVQAEGGVRGLELLAEGGVDIVLLDVLMPDMNGLDVLRRIRATPSTRDLPVIMVSAQAESRDIVTGLELGANDYVTKPVDFPVALARVAAQLGFRRAEQALAKLNQTLELNVAELHAAALKAQAANHAKSEFLANVTHEIRTPLNGVLGVAQVLAITQLDTRQRELVGVITSSAGLLERLLSDVLDLARVEAGHLVLAPEPVRLDDLARATAAMVEPSARSKGLEFTLSIEPAAEGVLEVDPTRLTQVLINLLANAVKFTAQGSVALQVVATPTGRRFVVRDTGIGFGPEVKERLFQRFEQGGADITKRFGGSGLGLSISRQLADLMGGTLTADAEEGRGAVFVLDLPLEAPNRMAA